MQCNVMLIQMINDHRYVRHPDIELDNVLYVNDGMILGNIRVEN